MKKDKNIPEIQYCIDYSIGGGDCRCACDLQTESEKITITKEKINISEIEVPNLEFYKFKENKFLIRNPNANLGFTVINDEAKELINKISKQESISKDKYSFIKTLIDRKLLLYKNKPNINETKTFSVWFQLTNACNYSCSYCYVKQNSQKMDIDIGLASLDKIFETVKQNKLTNLILKYGGGEPTLNFSVFEKLQEYALQLANKNNIELFSVFLTNASLLTQSHFDKFKQLKTKVMVSIDGSEFYHNAQRINNNSNNDYNIILNNTEKLKEMDLLSDVSITVSDKNIKGLPDFVEFCLRKDYPFNLNFYRENENATDESLTFSDNIIIKYLLKTYDKILEYLPNRNMLALLLDRVNLFNQHTQACGYDKNYLAINNDGSIAKCQMIFSETDKSIFNFKDVKKEFLSNSKQLSVENKQECSTCDLKYYCAGGCPLVIDARQKSSFCNIYRAVYQKIYQIEFERILKYGLIHRMN